MKPYLFIDVDGVLNPDRALLGYDRYEIMGYTVNLNRDDGTRLLALEQFYDLVWATSWQNLANVHISPKIGLPQLPFVPFQTEFPMFRASPDWVMVKTYEVVKFAHGKPFAWVDDDLQREDLEELNKYNCLPLRIWSFTGLKANHFTKLWEWGKEQSAKTP